MKIFCVEDGSVDIDALKIILKQDFEDVELLVYRQGAKPPFMIDIPSKELEPQDIEEIADNYSFFTDKLGVSVRTSNILYRSGIKSINQLKETSFNELKNLRNMGKKSLKEIYDKLIDFDTKQKQIPQTHSIMPKLSDFMGCI